MSSIVIAGDTSGSVTLQAPAVSGSTVLNLPSTSGTIQTSGAGYTTNGVAYATNATGLVTGSALVFDGTNLGIGTSSPSFPLHVQTNASGYALTLKGRNAGGNENWLQWTNFAGTTQAGMYATSDNLVFATSSSYTEGMRLTSTGLGIGTSSPSYKLNVVEAKTLTPTTGDGQIAIDNTTSGQVSAILLSSQGTRRAQISAGLGGTGNDGYLAFTTRNDSTGFAERARINSSGFLKASNTGSYIGSTGPYYEFTSNDTSTNQSFIFYNNNTSIAQTAMMFLGANRNTTNNTFYYFGCYNYQTSTYKMLIADSGNITNTNNSYGSISDVKLKENIVDASPKLADLMQVQVRNYNLIGETTKQLGVVAQELETVFPAMVDESPDRDAEGNDLGTTTKSVKYSVFVPMLIKAIQEQQALITTLTDRISVLENK